jgi:hypothetical protein
MNWLSRYLKQATPEQRPLTNTPALVTCGIVWGRVGWALCEPETDLRGVKIVTIPADLEARYIAAGEEWASVQEELQALPKSLRPRKRKAKVEVATE